MDRALELPASLMDHSDREVKKGGREPVARLLSLKSLTTTIENIFEEVIETWRTRPANAITPAGIADNSASPAQ